VPLTDKANLTLADTSEKLFFNVPRLAVSFEAGVPAPGATPSPFVLTDTASSSGNPVARQRTVLRLPSRRISG
jgi:hypothetical protein